MYRISFHVKCTMVLFLIVTQWQIQKFSEEVYATEADVFCEKLYTVLYIRDHGGLGFSSQKHHPKLASLYHPGAWQYWLGITKFKHSLSATLNAANTSYNFLFFIQ